MKTMKNFAGLMLMSFSAMVTFTACSDDLEMDKAPAVVESVDDGTILEPIGLVYTDFITPNDVQILDADTTKISVSKALADKMNITNFVKHPMGIWQAFDQESYLRRATRQELVGDRYILNVVPSALAEVLNGKDVKMETSIYVNENAPTRGEGSASRYVDENQVIHPSAVTLVRRPGETATRAGSNYGTFTPEQILAGELDPKTRGLWNWIKTKVSNAVKWVDNKTSYNLHADNHNTIISTSTTIDFTPIKFSCGKEDNDTITLKGKLPVDFELNYTFAIDARGSLVSLPSLKYFEASVDGLYGMAPQLTIGFEKELSIPDEKQKIKIADLGEFTFTFMVYCVPVTVTVQPHVFLKLNASVKGKAYIGLKYEYLKTFKAGLKYDGRWDVINESNVQKNEFSLMKPQADFEAEAGIGLMLGVDAVVCKVAGPTIAVGPQLKAEAALHITPFDQEKVNFEAAVKFGIYGEVGAKLKLWRWELAEWKTDFCIGKDFTIWQYPNEKDDAKTRAIDDQITRWAY